MARYRKLLIASPIGLAAIVMAIYSHQLVDWNPRHNQSVYVESGSEQVEKNQASNQNITPADDDHEVPISIEDRSITEVPPDETPTSKNITVSGWVGTEFGENIAFETVVLFSPSQKTYHMIATGLSGEFKFTDLKPGWDYVLEVSPQGMFKRYTKSQIQLRSDQEVHNIVLESIPLGVLSGKIVDPYDRPVTDLELFIKTVEIDLWTTSVITDANGTFSVAGFPKGRFHVATRGQQSLKASGFDFDPDTAVPINLTIDLGPYNLGGRIYDESGQTFDGADVFLNWALHENGVRIRSTRKVSVNTSGKFQFTGLGPGEHELVVSAWRGNTFKQTINKTINMGVDSGELIIVFNSP